MDIKIRASGGIRIDLGLIYYPLGELTYAVNSGGIKSIVKANPIYEEQSDEEKKKKKKAKIKYWELPVNEVENYIFEDEPINKDAPYKNPITRELASKWFSMKHSPKIDDVYKIIKDILTQCYDFSDERDLDTAVLFIIQSWFCDVLNAVFYIDVRSQMGGGKTILLELMQGLSRYGILANDMSFAVIPRIVDRYKCTLFFDEIDMINKHAIDDVFKMLRTGYRKGQKYIRAKPKTFEPEVFDCYSAKGFNYRSDIADDLKSRSLPINTSKSNDKVLPMLNLYKDAFMSKAFFAIWCFYMDSLPRLTEVEKIYAEEMVGFLTSDKVNEVNKVNELKVNNRTDNISLSSIRLHFYSTMISVNRKVFGLKLGTLGSNMPKNEVIEPEKSILTAVNLINLNDDEHIAYFNKLFENLCGRSIEIFTLIIQLCGYVGLDIYQNFKEILEEKAEFENHDEEDLKNILRELLIEMEVGARTHKDTKYKYYRDVQAEFMKKVHDAYGFKPTTSSMKKFLRELGFVDKINKKVMKFDNNQTSLVLMYDNKILKNLGLMDETNNRI